MKKLIAMLIALSLVLSACGGTPSSTPSSSTPSESTPVSSSTPESSTPDEDEGEFKSFYVVPMIGSNFRSSEDPFVFDDFIAELDEDLYTVDDSLEEDEGFVIYTMDPETYDTMMEHVTGAFEMLIGEMVEPELGLYGLAFRNGFTEFDFVVDAEIYDDEEAIDIAFSMMSVMLHSMTYQLMQNVDEEDVAFYVRIIDHETEEVIEEFDAMAEEEYDE